MDELLNRVTHGDCLDIMKRIPDESVDLVVADPPYGINFRSNHRKQSRLKSVDGIYNDGGGNTEFLAEVIADIDRVLKPNSHIYWFTRWDRIHLQLPVLQKHFNVKNSIVWMKNNWSMGDLTGSYAGQYETIIFAQKGRRALNEVDDRKRHADILQFDRVPSGKLRHSHEKPEDLIEFLIKKSSNIGDIVFDPFGGSGTTAVCAKRLGRDFVITELDYEYVEISNRRIGEVLTEGEALVR